MDRQSDSWSFTWWWGPVSFGLGILITWITTFFRTRRQFQQAFERMQQEFADHVKADERFHLEISVRAEREHSENTGRLAELRDDIKELRSILLGHYKGPEGGH